jgi:hypothetical protein
LNREAMIGGILEVMDATSGGLDTEKLGKDLTSALSELISLGAVTLKGIRAYPNSGSSKQAAKAKHPKAAQLLGMVREHNATMPLEELVQGLQHHAGRLKKEGLGFSSIDEATVRSTLDQFTLGKGRFGVVEPGHGGWRLTGLHHQAAAFDSTLRKALFEIKRREPEVFHRKVTGKGGLGEALTKYQIFWPNVTKGLVKRMIGVVPGGLAVTQKSQQYQMDLKREIPLILKGANVKSSTPSLKGYKCFRLPKDAGKFAGESIPVFDAKGNIIIGSLPNDPASTDESKSNRQRHPMGWGLVGVLAQTGSRHRVTRGTVIKTLIDLGLLPKRRTSVDLKRAVTTALKLRAFQKRPIKLTGPQGLATFLRKLGHAANPDEVITVLDQLKIERVRKTELPA